MTITEKSGKEWSDVVQTDSSPYMVAETEKVVTKATDVHREELSCPKSRFKGF